ncbi:MAG: response regulator [Deltaproteobacteria bacterium]|nr:response regulator [Deltaproteobacteria bacterium]
MLGRSVIIIDDKPDQRFVLKGLLTDIGCSVIGEGASGIDAVKLMQDKTPDVVFMDVSMPGMDGIDAVNLIKNLNPVPVILLTGKRDEETIKRAMDAGIFALLIKPVREEELMPAIELAIARFKEFNTVMKENQDLKEALEARKIIERAKGILMKKEGLSEKETFTFIQKTSMDRRQSMREVALAIISAFEGKKN